MHQSTSPTLTTASYVAPFLAFVGIMALERALSIPPQFAYPIRVCVVSALILALSRPLLHFRFTAPLSSIAVGAAVFVIWIGPDLLFDFHRFVDLYVRQVVPMSVIFRPNLPLYPVLHLETFGVP